MKRNLILVACLLMFLGAVPAYGFLDYVFGGGSEGEPAVGNSVVGDNRPSMAEDMPRIPEAVALAARKRTVR